MEDLVRGFHSDDRFGFDEVTYLLLFDKLPNQEELKSFSELLSSYRSLPTSFVRDIIMKAPSKDMMNTLARSVLTLYSYDDRADDVSLPNVLRQCLQLISLCPMLSIYGYQADSQQDVYKKMFEELKEEVRDWKDDEEISRYLQRLLNRDAFDHAGLIYGVGHAVYSKSDPRAVIFKGFVERLSEEKGLHDEFELYNSVERLAPIVISGQRQMYKGVSVNVDFYSGFVYKMLGLPIELYTPIFAIARMVGWSAHRMEELATNGKIIRPAYKTLCVDRDYVELENR